jgi:hypothetical protein
MIENENPMNEANTPCQEDLTGVLQAFKKSIRKEV